MQGSIHLTLLLSEVTVPQKKESLTAGSVGRYTRGMVSISDGSKAGLGGYPLLYTRHTRSVGLGAAAPGRSAVQVV